MPRRCGGFRDRWATCCPSLPHGLPGQARTGYDLFCGQTPRPLRHPVVVGPQGVEPRMAVLEAATVTVRIAHFSWCSVMESNHPRSPVTGCGVTARCLYRSANATRKLSKNMAEEVVVETTVPVQPGTTP